MRIFYTLVLLLVVPLLPFDTLGEHSIGDVSLRLVVLMYACELILARNKSSFKILRGASVLSLLIIGFPAIKLFI